MLLDQIILSSYANIFGLKSKYINNFAVDVLVFHDFGSDDSETLLLVNSKFIVCLLLHLQLETDLKKITFSVSQKKN